jgi:threonine efflux protein
MFTTLLTIWLLHAAALITPGPNVLLISQLAAAGRTRSAVLASAGVASGALLWSTLAVLGVHTVFHAVPALRIGLQVCGGLYLLYLAWRLWRAPVGDDGQASTAPLSALQALRMGLLTNLTNPKSALFFGSVFAAALPPAPSAALLVAAVTMAVANALVWHLLLAFLFSRRRIRGAYAAQRRLANRVAGVVVGAFGCRLLAVSAQEVKTL